MGEPKDTMQQRVDKADVSTGKDRFEKISNDYGELFTEVFAEQGMNYDRLQRSVLETVAKTAPNFRDLPILDIGIGDGATSAAFVEAGSKNITGIDLNPEMLAATKDKFGETIRLREMNATDMSAFHTGDFPIIIAGAAIHNIPIPERGKFWKEILRLSPDTLVLAEKVKDPDPVKHQADYNREVAAIREVYGKRHGLKEAEEEWVRHYEYDEREALTMNEIKENIADQYDTSVVFEMGLYKMVLAIKKK